MTIDEKLSLIKTARLLIYGKERSVSRDLVKNGGVKIVVKN